MNQFHEFCFLSKIHFFAISKMAKNQFLNWRKSLKLPKMQFHENFDLFDFSIFCLPGLFLIFLPAVKRGGKNRLVYATNSSKDFSLVKFFWHNRLFFAIIEIGLTSLHKSNIMIHSNLFGNVFDFLCVLLFEIFLGRIFHSNNCHFSKS